VKREAKGIRRQTDGPRPQLCTPLRRTSDSCNENRSATVMYAGENAERAPTRQLLSAATHPDRLSLSNSFSSRTDHGAALPRVCGTVLRPEESPTSCRSAGRYRLQL
jgi:ABC-type dipeptide/oligopeptide/nickel transport system ATPase component